MSLTRPLQSQRCRENVKIGTKESKPGGGARLGENIR
jgi:hypothetical protein